MTIPSHSSPQLEIAHSYFKYIESGNIDALASILHATPPSRVNGASNTRKGANSGLVHKDGRSYGVLQGACHFNFQLSVVTNAQFDPPNENIESADSKNIVFHDRRWNVQSKKVGIATVPYTGTAVQIRWCTGPILASYGTGTLDFDLDEMTVGSCEIAPRTLTVEFFNNPYRPVPAVPVHREMIASIKEFIYAKALEGIWSAESS
ncbi:hypothetical protein C8R43DRAFT_962052 [Mycena crocata]|nr:hypothetical protein C8R43DRAFT_962052 [Mycena crocata]